MTRATILFLLLTAAATPALHAQPAPAAAANTDAQSIETRITAIQVALQITTEQLPAWNSFAAAMRDNAVVTDALFRDRAANARLMSATDNMRSYAAVARAYADATQKLSDAFATLYAVLSDRQKELADTMFRQQAVPAINAR